MESEKTRIPTIFEGKIESQTGSSARNFRLPSPPNLAEINDCVIRVLDTKDLGPKLEEIGVDIHHIACIIARAKSQKMMWEHGGVIKARGIDNVKKVRKRSENKAPEKYCRKQELKTLTIAAARKRFASADTSRLRRSSTKQRPYLKRLLFVLHYILSEQTDDPYRYMAALFNLFNLHAEDFCRIGSKTCPSLDQTNNVCKRRRILTCPKHEYARHNVWSQTRKEKKRYGDLSTRLADSYDQP